MSGPVHEIPPSAVLERLPKRVDAEKRVASHQLTVLPSSDAHLRGGHFSPVEMLGFRR